MRFYGNLQDGSTVPMASCAMSSCLRHRGLQFPPSKLVLRTLADERCGTENVAMQSKPVTFGRVGKGHGSGLTRNCR